MRLIRDLKYLTEREQQSLLLFLTCFLMYTVVCFTKSSYTASIAFLVNEGIFSKSDSGLISAAFYLTYGFGQVLGGGLTDRFSPYKVVGIGLLGSILSNLVLCFTSQFSWVLIVWSICGLVQFGVWPGVAKIIAGVLIPEHRQKAGVYIVLCLGMGGVFSYLTATPVLEARGFSGVFGLNTVLLLVVFVLWEKIRKKTENSLMPTPLKRVKVESKTGGAFAGLLFKSGLFLLVIVNMITSLLGNGLKAWVSTMMMESYGLSPHWASIQTMLIYIANIFGTFVVIYLFRKIKSEPIIVGVAMVVCLPMYGLILLIGQIPAWMILAALIVSTTVLYALGNVNVRIANAFEPYGYSGTATGALNAMASFGIVLANGGFGFIAEHFGWSSVTVSLVAFCAFAALLCVPATVLWRKVIEEETL